MYLHTTRVCSRSDARLCYLNSGAGRRSALFYALCSLLLSCVLLSGQVALAREWSRSVALMTPPERDHVRSG
eukprot:2474347-Rhodomonas_salina.1